MGQTIAALDLGTSKSIAFVAQKDYLGKISVLRTEVLSSKGVIRRGRIYNLDETSNIVSQLMGKLNSNPADLQVEKIYVGIGGQTLQTKLFTSKKITVDGTISQQLLDSLREEAISYKPGLKENLGIYSCEYYADGHPVSNPKGTMASVIEARFQLIVGDPCLRLNLEKVFKDKKVSIAGYFISPLATAEAVLSPEEKESGCALVELGEGVTYVSIYKNKALKYMVTIPLGGLAITKDIRILNISESEAEELKKNHGSALSNPEDNREAPVNEEQNSSKKIELRRLNQIIEGRVNEIVGNIWNQIQISGYSQAIDAGIIITGGGALLQDFPQYIKNMTGKEVRLAKVKVWENGKEIYLSPANSCVAGLVILGKENWVKGTLTKEQVQSGSLFGIGEIDEVDKKDGKKNGKKKEKDKENPDPINPIENWWKKVKGVLENSGEIVFEDDMYDNNKNNNTANKQ